MKVAVVADSHYVRTHEGKIWVNSIYDYSFFLRYLNVFDSVQVVSRVKDSNSDVGSMLQSNGDKVNFYALSDFNRLKGVIKTIKNVKKELFESFQGCDCAIVRTPSALSPFAVGVLKKMDLPFAIELVADPWEVYSLKSYSSLFSPVIQCIMTLSTKRACILADGVAYVSQHALQKRYKNNKESFVASYSSASIGEDYLGTPKNYGEQKKFIFAHIANDISDDSKGHKKVIDIIKSLNCNGFNVSIKFIGDGNRVSYFKNYANKIGITEKVNFVGRIGNPALLRKELIESDLYIFPSVTEGLPRCLIEAMACGLPCVASNVGGIPELIDNEYLFNYKDTNGFVTKLKELLNNTGELNEMSKENIENAKKYLNSSLEIKRTGFYQELKDRASCMQKKG